MFKKNSENYISLREATTYCDYSQEYLSLRARQRKLKGVKFGRNWVTKKEWVEEYLKKAEKYRDDFKKCTFISESPFVQKNNYSAGAKFKKTSPRIGFLLALMLTLLIWSAFVNGNILNNIYKNVSYFTAAINMESNQGVAMKENANETSQILKEYFYWLYNKIESVFIKISKPFLVFGNFVKAKFAQGYEMFSGLWKRNEKVAEKQPVPVAGKNGMVVIPSAEENDNIIDKIKKSFSDEVEVEQKNDSWGVIKPIFKEPSPQEYLYIMVPIKN